MGDDVGAAVPGTRFALGVRFGSPELVVPPRAGSRTAPAACQPLSAGDDHSAESRRTVAPSSCGARAARVERGVSL
jgi:hypothetical protein